MKTNKRIFREMAVARKNNILKSSYELDEYLKEYSDNDDICFQYGTTNSDGELTTNSDGEIEYNQFIGIRKVPEFLSKFSDWNNFIISAKRVEKTIYKLSESEIWDCLSPDIEEKLTKQLKNIFVFQDNLNDMFFDIINQALEFNKNNGFIFNNTRHCVYYPKPNQNTFAWCYYKDGKLFPRDSFTTSCSTDRLINSLFPADNRFFREFLLNQLEDNIDNQFFFLMYSDVRGVYLDINKRLNYYHLNINTNFNTEYELDDEEEIKQRLENWATSFSGDNRSTTYRKILFTRDVIEYSIDIEFDSSVKSLIAYLTTSYLSKP